MHGTDLTFQRRVTGERRDRKRMQIRREDLVRMNRFCHCIGDGVSPQDFTERHAHFRAQHPGSLHRCRDVVALCQLPDKAVINDLRIQGQHQISGIKSADRALKPEMRLLYRGKHLPFRREGFFQRRGNVLHQHCRGAHIHQKQIFGTVRFCLYKALPLEDIQGFRVTAPPDGISAVGRGGVGQGFRQKKLPDVVISPRRADSIKSRQKLDPPCCMGPDIIRQFFTAKGFIKVPGIDDAGC